MKFFSVSFFIVKMNKKIYCILFFLEYISILSFNMKEIELYLEK